VLTLTAACCAGAVVPAVGQGTEASIRYVVSVGLRASANGEGFVASVWVADRPAVAVLPTDRAYFRGLFMQLGDRQTRDQFVMMVRTVLSGRGRMTVELDGTGKTITSVRLDVAA